jgi:hypothetical protein
MLVIEQKISGQCEPSNTVPESGVLREILNLDGVA